MTIIDVELILCAVTFSGALGAGEYKITYLLFITIHLQFLTMFCDI